jgi:hypothetical protein
MPLHPRRRSNLKRDHPAVVAATTNVEEEPRLLPAMSVLLPRKPLLAPEIASQRDAVSS